MKPNEIFGKYAPYLFICYAVLKVVFEYGQDTVHETNESTPSADMVQENVDVSSNTGNGPRNVRSRS